MPNMKNMSTLQEMSIKNCLFLAVIFYSILIAHETRGFQLTNEENTDLDKQFQLLQKPSIKMIQTESGDIYDCVDFYQQPAFDHPLLKNHTFHPEMRPSFSLNSLFICDDKVQKSIKLKDGGCPRGTVPIRRVTKDEFYNIHNFTRDYAKSNNIQSKPGTHVAFLHTISNPTQDKYSGVGANFNFYNLSVEQSQYSSGEFVIQNGDDRIKVGWTVNPTLYKTVKGIHLFQYLDAGQLHCFNTLCPGFVNVRQDTPIDVELYPSSIRGGDQIWTQLHVYQDVVTGHWWLYLCKIGVGFWPKQIFKTLSNSATYIAVGGEAYGPTDRPLPSMGSGYYPVKDIRFSGFSTDITLVDGNHKKIDHPQTQVYADDPHYGVIDAGDTGFFGRTIFYGGPNR